ncbi:lycopene cyclase domain-containing protein [Agrococcus sp. 1P02AA]|uniref:lycopene cyclase domain-containing protein n=1 Tax=Agrococcus sp. 1P02AA TaxID=3132259 RepID=UPI0039A679DA
MYALLLAPALVIAVGLAAWALRRDRRGWAAVAIAAAAVLLLTVVFDSLMIAADLFRFDEALLLGVRIGLAPVEDLGYALIAVLVAAATWRLWPARRPAGRLGSAASGRGQTDA